MCEKCKYLQDPISLYQLYVRKVSGCYSEYGLAETTQRLYKEFIRVFRKYGGIKISYIEANIAIGAAPKDERDMKELIRNKISHIIDLRAGVRETDICRRQGSGIIYKNVPTYDDWRPKTYEFYAAMEYQLANIFNIRDDAKIFICCGAGEHRAPIGGVVALIFMGYSLEAACQRVMDARQEAEILPAYKESLANYMTKRPHEK